MSFHLDGVSFRYPGSAASAPVLRDVSVELPAGEVIAVLGPSGCGKTTLLNLLSLLWEGDGQAGTIVYRDGPARFDYRELGRDPRRRAALRRERFGVVLQNCYLLPHFSCLHNVCLPLALLGWSEPEQAAWSEALIRVVGAAPNDLWEARHRMPRAVSLGQRQRFAVLRAVAHHPRVVFADEPTSNLDPASMHAVLQLLLDWHAGRLLHRAAAALDPFPTGLRERLERGQAADAGPRTLILVCHQRELARACADRVLLFDAEHRLADTFTAGRWAELDARAGAVLRLAPLERSPP